MPVPPSTSDFPKGTRRRIIDLLRRSPLTASEVAAELGLSGTAVRDHLTALQLEGLVRKGGLRRGSTRPAALYELVPRAEAVFSKAYVPFVAQLLRVLGERMTRAELDDVMQAVGHRLAGEWPRLHGDLRQRVEAASLLLVELGAVTEVESRDGGFVLRGYGCLLSEAVHGRPEVCRSVESLLAHLVEAPVRECCERGEHPRCCFMIALDHPTAAAANVGTT
jgi:predicted ArsR family transcriptional regulator